MGASTPPTKPKPKLSRGLSLDSVYVISSYCQDGTGLACRGNSISTTKHYASISVSAITSGSASNSRSIRSRSSSKSRSNSSRSNSSRNISSIIATTAALSAVATAVSILSVCNCWRQHASCRAILSSVLHLDQLTAQGTQAMHTSSMPSQMYAIVCGARLLSK